MCKQYITNTHVGLHTASQISYNVHALRKVMRREKGVSNSSQYFEIAIVTACEHALDLVGESLPPREIKIDCITVRGFCIGTS